MTSAVRKGRILRLLNDDRLELGPAPTAGLNSGPWKNWTLSRQESGIVWLLLDREGTGVNSLDQAVLEELDAILGELDKQPPKVLVIRSAKQSGFCAGADIGMFREINNVDAARAMLERAHNIVDRLEKLPSKKVAVIHGTCLGGGLELALACDIRIATNSASLGFPEVLLGLHPGLGGTYRTTRLINPIHAMTLMLTGKTWRANKAKQMGLVDAVTEERHIANAVGAVAEGKFQGWKPPPYLPLLNLAPARRLLARRMESETEEKVSPEHYPAPYRLIDLWRHRERTTEAQQKAEIDSFSSLLVGAGTQNLVRVFFLRERLKTAKSGAGAIGHIHVVGAGTMGGDIAAWCALQGYRVTLADRDETMIARSVKRAASLYKRKYLSGIDRRDTLDRLIPDPSDMGVAHADLIIEAVPEKIDIKRAVYAQIQRSMKPDAILATNTSSIPLETLRESITDPARFVGLHFFNPVAQMQLVEVVSHDGVSDNTLSLARALVSSIDRLPVPVKSAPGFLVNRVLTPYLLEAMLMLDEGIKAETLDRAAEEFGMPIGPIELADQVGLDICLDVGDTLRSQLTVDIPRVPSWISDKVDNGDTGRKAGKGFYHWDDNGAQKSESETPPAGTEDRLILPLVNACIACLAEGIVDNPDTLDAAVIFGTGFAPFRGGPINYARTRGIGNIVEALENLEHVHGARFRPSEGWRELEND